MKNQKGIISFMGNIYKLFFAFSAVFSAGFIGSFFTAVSIGDWYGNLNKPFFNPPSWVFGPVWTVLYILMALSFFIVLISQVNPILKRKAQAVFAVQLILNSLWSFLFFGIRRPDLAFIGILILWLFIGLTVYFFKMISKTASRLLIPYFAWVSFAAVLNLSIVFLN